MASAISEAIEAADAKLFKFVLTGGPCSGKTTASARLQAYLSERGFRVFIVPEAATILFLNGAAPSDFGLYPKTGVAFQHFVLSSQIHLEDAFTKYAQATGCRCVLLCDRGLMDGAAYVTEAEFNDVLAAQGLDVVRARDNRYNAVLHLVTAADGAEDHYTLANNMARHEGPSEARSQDSKTQAAWAGHPHHLIIDNEDGITFEQKMEKLVGLVAGYVGLQPTPRKTHVFQLSEMPAMETLPSVQIFKVEKVMLSDPADPAEAESPKTPTAGLGLELGPDAGVVGSRENSGAWMGLEGLEAVPLRRALSGLSVMSDYGSAGDKEKQGRVLYCFVRKRSSVDGGGSDSYGLTTVRE